MATSATQKIHDIFREAGKELDYDGVVKAWRKQHGMNIPKKSLYEYAKQTWRKRQREEQIPAVALGARTDPPPPSEMTLVTPPPKPVPVPENPDSPLPQATISESPKPQSLGDMFEKLEASLDTLIGIAKKSADEDSANMVRKMRRLVSRRILELEQTAK